MQQKFTTLFALMVLVVICNHTLAQDDSKSKQFAGRELAGYHSNILKQKFHSFSVIQLSSKEIADYCKSGNAIKKLHLQAGTKFDFDLELEPSNLIASNYKLQVITPEGTRTLNSTTDFLYKGVTSDGGAVRLAIKEGFISGTMRKGGLEYFIEPMRRYTADAGADDFIVYEPADLIDTLFSCGYNDAKQAIKNSADQKIYSPLSVQEIGCKKIKFVMVADYSMYQKFNYDITALEAELLSALNAGESFYNGFNFNGDSATDTGSDIIKFEATNLVVSTCKACDVVSNPYQSGLIFVNFLPWIRKNLFIEGLQVNQYWTTYNLNVGGPILGLAGGYGSGCSDTLMQLQHYGGSLPLLRIQVAHETGHNLGCVHDDFIKPSVNSFVMNSGARVNALRFSQLSDFGGIRYSSNLVIRDTITTYNACPGACIVSTCYSVTGLRIDSSYKAEGTKIEWKGSGEFIVKYKLQQATAFDSANINTVSGNSSIIKNLDPCAAYYLEVVKQCSDGRFHSESINFSTFYISVSLTTLNLRGELYDLSVQLNRITGIDKDVYVKVDHQGPFLKIIAGQTSISISDLFADGARHRLDILLDTNSTVCKKVIYYKAPYYRGNSKKLVYANFNDRTLPALWTDSIFIKPPAGYISPQLIIRDSSFLSYAQLSGNLDSTSVLFYEHIGQKVFNGNLSLITPAVDIRAIQDPMLSFDYKFLSYGMSGDPNYLPASFTILVFDGNEWKEVFRQENNSHPYTLYRNIWDTIPSRVFIPLKQYTNSKLQVQFVMDDGTRTGIQGPYFFTALDNILIDGYDTSNIGRNNISFKIFPNPSSEIIYIRDLPLGETYSYTITDVLGRDIKKELLANYKVDISNLASGVYFFSVFQNGVRKMGASKFVKH